MLNTDQLQSQIEKYKKQLKLQYVVMILLAVLAIFLVVSRRSAVVQKEESYAQGLELKGEYDALMEEYTSIKIENQDFSSQLSERDSVIMANANEIKHLIATQADYRKIKKKLDLLRAITQDYVSRIDSLVVVNHQLNQENVQIKEEISTERQKNTALTESKQLLEGKVSEASVFKAYNLSAITIRRRSDNKEVLTDRAKRLDRINISFILSENKIVEAGPKTIYVRIARPDGEILMVSQNDAHSFEVNGEQLQYSLAKTIDYKNAAQEVKISWDRQNLKQAAMEGLYNVNVFVDGKEIGKTSFIVRP
ncbi:MAG: hypothetical protein RR190_00730 [Bacteroidales bacterium]